MLINLAKEREELNCYPCNFGMLLQCVQRKFKSALVDNLLTTIVLAEEPFKWKLKDLKCLLEVSKELDEEAEDHKN